MSECHCYLWLEHHKLSRSWVVISTCCKPVLQCALLSGVLLLQAIVDLADALEAASLGKSREQQQQLCQQQGQLLQWLRHKLPTNTDLAQVCNTACVLHCMALPGLRAFCTHRWVAITCTCCMLCFGTHVCKHAGLWSLTWVSSDLTSQTVQFCWRLYRMHTCMLST